MTNHKDVNRKDPKSLHVPVMLERTLELLGPSIEGKDAVLIDCTLGLGGHSEAFLRAFPELTVIGIDRDPKAIEIAKERLAEFSGRIHFVQTTYDNILETLEELEIESADAILMDLGVSSMQIDEGERGFAYSFDAPLDMRMDGSSGQTAADLIARGSEEELARIFKDYGEERFAKKVASEIIKQRVVAPIVSSKELAALIARVIPFIPGKSSGHPAKRVFQALRIAVNEELEILENAVPAAISALTVGGRLLVLSYHSLEDRIVKQAIAKAATSSAPIDMPFELPEQAPSLKLIVKGAEQASLQEIAQNPRSASVRLRVAEKIRKVA
jgi:16S rRNA (cytosine1402-N4)-methyltransferase